jgi:hypothetical protein
MMKSKLRDSKTRRIDDKNRSALRETTKVKKGFKTKENSKRNAALREKGHKLIKKHPSEKRVLESNPDLVETKVWDIDTGKSETILVNRKVERELDRLVDAAFSRKETHY